MNIPIDIETIPCQLDWYREELAHEAENTRVKVPKSYRKEDSIKLYVAAKKKELLDAVEERWRESALDGSYGEIVVICTKTNGHTRAMFQSEDTDEARLLQTFCDWIETQLTSEGLHRKNPHWIGFNVGFDLRFIWKRLKIHGLHAPFPLYHNDVPWASKNVSDVQYLWCGARAEKGLTLTRLCQILGIQVADGVLGEDVWPLWEAQEYDAVIDHCIADVERTSELWRKLK